MDLQNKCACDRTRSVKVERFCWGLQPSSIIHGSDGFPLLIQHDIFSRVFSSVCVCVCVLPQKHTQNGVKLLPHFMPCVRLALWRCPLCQHWYWCCVCVCRPVHFSLFFLKHICFGLVFILHLSFLNIHKPIPLVDLHGKNCKLQEKFAKSKTTRRRTFGYIFRSPQKCIPEYVSTMSLAGKLLSIKPKALKGEAVGWISSTSLIFSGLSVSVSLDLYCICAQDKDRVSAHLKETQMRAQHN